MPAAAGRVQARTRLAHLPPIPPGSIHPAAPGSAPHAVIRRHGLPPGCISRLFANREHCPRSLAR